MNDKTNKTASSAGGLELGTVLTIIFVVLKLCGVINWSWLWVLSPAWISLAFSLLLLLILFVVYRRYL